MHDLLAELEDLVVSALEECIELDDSVLQGLLVVAGGLLGVLQTQHLLQDGLHRVGSGFLRFSRHLGWSSRVGDSMEEAESLRRPALFLTCSPDRPIDFISFIISDI